MTVLSAYVEAIGVRGPGLADWPSTAAVLCGAVPYDSVPTELPPPGQLPSAERRRAVPVVRIAFAAAEEALRALQGEPGPLPTVFASSGGDGLNYHQICETLASDNKKISPTRFHNSVHNAPSGYWSIATRDMATSNVLCAHDASFGAGLLDALAQVVCDGGRVMLVAYESDYPEPLHSVRPIAASFGVAFVLAAEPSAHAVARIDVSLADAPADTLADAALETLRRGVPAARSLPLLAAFAALAAGDTREPVERVIEYQPDSTLHITVNPC
jgi:Beta-ketoacyl synthase, N-terminal domain